MLLADPPGSGGASVGRLPARPSPAAGAPGDRHPGRPGHPARPAPGQGKLLEVRAECLRFTPAEARTYLVERMGLSLSDAEIEALAARTEGWPAALQLAGLSLVGREDVGGFVRDFTGTHRFILDFITLLAPAR
jgi:hypothetical protein